MEIDQSVFTLIAALSALFAVLLGPLASMHIANRQVRLNTHSQNRQSWINNLRDAIAEYISAMVLTSARSASGKATEGDHLDSLTALARIESKIELMLNPKEGDHLKLMKLMSECSKGCWRQNVDNVADMPSISSGYRTEIVALSQQILKREWERVKAVN